MELFCPGIFFFIVVERRSSVWTRTAKVKTVFYLKFEFALSEKNDFLRGNIQKLFLNMRV